MRISSNQFYLQALSSMGAQQSQAAELQQNISTGRRILTPSDDPAGITKSLSLRQGIARFAQFEENSIVAEQRNQQEETTLGSVNNLLQRVKELAIQAKSGIQNSDSKAAIATEVKERLAELFELGNTRDANGDYLFSGFKGKSQAFVKVAGGINYNGDQGQQQIKIGTTRQIASSDSGFEVFERIRNGNGDFRVDANAANTGTGILDAGSLVNSAAFQANNFAINFTSATTYDVVNTTTATTVLAAQPYVEGQAINFNGIETKITGAPATGDSFTVTPSQYQDVFTTLQDFVDNLVLNDTNNSQKAFVDQKLNNSIDDLDRAIDHILNIRTGIGARLSALESVKDENESAKAQMQITLAQIQDTDLTAAISQLQQVLQTLEASQATFARLERVNLFNFL